MKYAFTFKSTYETRAKTGFESLLGKMHIHDTHVYNAEALIGTALDELAKEKFAYEKNLEKGEGKSKNKQYKSNYEFMSGEIMTDLIDKLSKLPTGKQEGRTQQQETNIEQLRDALPALISKEGVDHATEILKDNIGTQMESIHMRKAGARDRWGKVQDNVGKLAQLTPNPMKYEIAIDSQSYGHEVDPFAPPGSKHYAVPLGGQGLEPLVAIKQMLETGAPPVHYQGLRSEHEGVSLYDVMTEALRESGGNRNKLCQLIEKEFSGSPDIPEMWIQKSFTGVKYLEPQERGEYELTIRDGKLYQGEELFDTSHMLGKNSGGKAAFVIVRGPDDKVRIMAGEHVGGEFHHSSFKSGERVIAAGMIDVREGQVKFLDNTSGHYKPEEHNIDVALRLLPELLTTFHPEGVIKIHHSPSQVAPERPEQFQERAGPLAQEKWEQLQKEQRDYHTLLEGSLKGKSAPPPPSISLHDSIELEEVSLQLKGSGLKEKSGKLEAPSPIISSEKQKTGTEIS